MPRTILHVDMDQFYAAVEMRDRPELKQKPVIVGADPQGGRGRGVVSTANYLARKFGVHSAQPISLAYKLCPQGVFLPVDMEKYARVSDQIYAIFSQYSPLVETLSLDEAFLDITQSQLLMGDGPTAARKLKRQVLQATGLSCSVGVAPNKLLAKIASDLKKPDGLVVVEPGGEAEFLAPLPIGRLWGVGKKTEAILNELGIHSIGDAQKYPFGSLKQRLGNYAVDLKEMALGHDERPVEPEHEAKSLGRETTFEHDSDSLPLLRQTLAELCEEVATRLRRHGWLAGQVTLKLRWEGFETHTRQSALKSPSSHAPDLFKLVEPMLKDFLKSGRRVRLIGISAGKLQGRQAELQMNLFEDRSERKQKIDQALDMVHQRFGEKALQRASQLGLSNSRFQEQAKAAGQEKRVQQKYKRK